jgi:uncharacterized damage-inducible protein DinB
MKRSDISPMPEYFDRYINRVKDKELKEAFEDSLEEIDELKETLNEENGGYRYAEGKWNLKEIIQHVIDCERIFCYRTLLFARRDKTVPAGFDQDLLVNNSGAGNRTIKSLLKEITILRMSTIELFQSFDDETLLNKGINWKYEMSVLAMGFLIIGHQSHHFNIIRSKYLAHESS